MKHERAKLIPSLFACLSMCPYYNKSIITGKHQRNSNIKLKEISIMKSKTKKILADDGFNPELVLGARFEGVLRFPCIEAHRGIIVPDSLIPFTKIEKHGNRKAFVAEYEHDCFFGTLVRDPQGSIDAIKTCGGFIATDNSVYLNAPLAVQIANIYRSRAIGYFMQSHGIYTIGNFRGGSEELYTDKIFKIPPVVDGLPRNSIIAISPYGCVKHYDERKHFEASLYVMLDYLHPKVVLTYSHGADKILKTLRHKTQFVVYNDWISIMHGKEAHGIWL